MEASFSPASVTTILPILRTASWATSPIAVCGVSSPPATMCLTGGFHVGFVQGPSSAELSVTAQEYPTTDPCTLEPAAPPLRVADEPALNVPLTVVWQRAADRLTYCARADEASPFRAVPLPHAPLGTDAVLLSTVGTHATSWLTHPHTATLLSEYCTQQLGRRFYIFFAPTEGSLIVTTARSAPTVETVVKIIFRRSSMRITDAPFILRKGWIEPLRMRAQRKRHAPIPAHTQLSIANLSPRSIETIFQ